MRVELDHTIVHSRDQRQSAVFLAEILGLGQPKKFGHFDTVQLGNGVTLDFMDAGPNLMAQHYAFLVDENSFDEILSRIRERGIEYWADPLHKVRNTINTDHGGRGLYFNDPSGHNLEVLTKS